MLFVFSAKFEIMENCDVVFYNVSSGLAAMDQLRDIIDPSLNDKPEVTFKEIPILAEAFERYRWPTTMALQGNINIISLLIFVLDNEQRDYEQGSRLGGHFFNVSLRLIYGD